MLLRLDLLIALVVFVAFFFVNAGVAGVGSSFSLLLVLFLIRSVQLVFRKSPPLTDFSRVIFLWFLFYFTAMLFSFLISDSMTQLDVRYLVSVFSISFFFILVPTKRSVVGDKVICGIAKGVYFTSWIVIIVWGYFVTINSNFFTLRLAEEPSGWQALTLFFNPNLAARVIILLLIFLLFFLKKYRNKFTLCLSMVLSVIVISTMSRANIVSLLAIWFLWVILFHDLSKKILFLIIFSVIVIIAVQYNPKVVERFTNLSKFSIVSDDKLRARTWSASFDIIKENPYVGIGKSKEINSMLDFGSVTWDDKHRVIITHGGFLKIAVYAGLGCLAIMIIMLIKLAVMFNRKSSSNNRNIAATMGFITIASLVPMNIGADSLELAITWFTVSCFVSWS